MSYWELCVSSFWSRHLCQVGTRCLMMLSTPSKEESAQHAENHEKNKLVVSVAVNKTNLKIILPTSGSLALARRRMGGWNSNKEMISLSPYDVWVYPGNLGIVITSWFSENYTNVRSLMLINNSCIIFICKVAEINFNWKFID